MCEASRLVTQLRPPRLDLLVYKAIQALRWLCKGDCQVTPLPFCFMLQCISNINSFTHKHVDTHLKVALGP